MTADYWKRIDTGLMGRKTYEVGLRQGQGGVVYPGITSYVFWRTLRPDSDRHLTIISADAPELVRQLKHQDGMDICLTGGGELAQWLSEADLIDEIGFDIHPLLLGSGIPAFHVMNRQIDLELVTSRAFKNDWVLLTYRVRR